MLKRLSIRYKIGFIALIGFIGFFIFQAASYRLSINIRDQMENILAQDFPVLKFSNDVQVSFAELDKLYQASLAEADMDTLLEADAKATQMRMEFERIGERFNANDPTFNELHRIFNEYAHKTSAHTAAVLSRSINYEETLAGYAEVGLLRERYHEVQAKFLEQRYQAFENQLARIEEDENFLVRFGLVLGIILTAILGGVSLVIIRRLIYAFNNAVTVAEQIAGGNLDQEIEVLAQDETGQLMESLHAMRDALKTQNEENHQREKIQNFLAGLNEAMRGDKNLEDLCNDMLDYIASELHAQLGAFYLLELNMLQMTAAYAYPQDDAQPVSFRLGQSIVGQAAMERQPQIITDVPAHYFQVGTGVGRATPRSILLFPVLFEHKLKGLIEIAAFRTFNDDDLMLMQRCNDAIAIAINSAQSRLKVAGMLQQTQEQAQELQHQRHELAEINRKLEERTMDLDEQKNQILQKNTELEESRKELLEKSEALELSGKYKSQFLSTMSHELRTPLNSILILSEALMDNRENHLYSNEVEHARVIHTAGEDLLTLINDILDLSKVEEGKMELVIDAISIHDLAFNLKHQFDYVAAEKGLDYQVNVAEQLPEYFYSDRHRLRQIIKNFISNALKFTHEGGVYVDICRPGTQDIPAESPLKPEDALLIRVRDTGVGIEKNKQALVFEAFKQADGTTSRKYGGTGLGLTISKELAKLLGGHINLYSQGSGKGSIFSLLLPLGEAASVPQHVPLVSEQHAPLPLPLPEVHLADEIALLAGPMFFPAFIEQAEKYKLPLRLFATVDELRLYLQNRKPRAVLIGQPHLDALPAEVVQQLAKSQQLFLQSEERTDLEAFNYLPLRNDPAVAQSLANNFSRGLHAPCEKVLVIEDNRVFHEVVRSVFSRNQLAVTLVETGGEALEALSEHLYDYLVVDLNLPDIHGVELISLIRKLPPYRHARIVLFTAEDLGTEQLQQIQPLVNDVVTKSPTAISEICQDAKAYIQRRAENPWCELLDGELEQKYQPGALNGRLILLVDDDMRNLYSITTALEVEGLRVMSAQSGQEALTLLADNSDIDLMLLDIMMPEMDGYQVLQQLRQQSQWQQLPVVALTAKAMVGDREKCLAAGASAYLSKPVDVQVLLQMILNLLPKAASTVN